MIADLSQESNFFPSQKKRKSLSPVEYRDMNQRIQRVWSHYLPAPAQALVAMIFDRTFGWSKKRERISFRQFKEGVFSREGGLIHGGTGIGEDTARKWLGLLIEAGAVKKTSAPAGIGADSYELVAAWEPEPLAGAKPRSSRTITSKEIMGLRQPKSRRNRENAEDEPPENLGGSPRENRVKEHVILKKPKAKEYTPPPSASEGRRGKDLDELLGEVEQRSAVKANSRLSASYDKVPAQKILGPLFNDLLLASHPDALPLTGKDVVILSQNCRRWVSQTGKPFDEMLDFLKYLISRWHMLRSTSFASMTRFPDYPAVRFIFAGGMLPALWAAFHDRAFLATLDGMHPDEAETALLARRKGITLEEARLILAPRHTGREKAALEESKKELAYQQALGNQTAAARRARRNQR